MQSIAQKLAGKIAITSGGTVQASPRPTTSAPRRRTTVEVLYDYLKIFPNELGTFDSEPTSVISQINRQAKYGYNNWRIPTNEELSLLKANNYLGNGEYMTRESRRGKVLLVTDGKDYATVQAEEREQERLAEEARIKAERERLAEESRIKAEQEREAEQARIIAEQKRQEELKAQGLVDLGLPSGTLWTDKNLGYFFTYNQAMGIIQNGKRLPTKAQLEELRDKCKWDWDGNGYRVTGPNGNTIIMRAEGYHDNRREIVFGKDTNGYYLSSTATGKAVRGFSFNNYFVNVDFLSYNNSYSVRLVKNP